MVVKWLKQILPRGLYGRAILILLVPIITLQLVISVAFLQRHFDKVTQQMTRSVAISIAYLLEELSNAPDQAALQAVAEKLGQELGFIVHIPAGAVTEARIFYDLSGKSVIHTVDEVLPSVQAIDLGNLDVVRLWAETPHGMAEIVFPRLRVSASNPHQLLVIMVFASILMTAVAYGFLRNQLRPITRLANAAEAFGRGRVVSYRPRGATEVRAAGSAFLDMRARIERSREQRTLLLSGVSHDLRTPLTRLKLGLSLSPDDEDTRAMKRDVDDMEHMLEGFLAFVRGEADESIEPVVPSTIAHRVVDNAARIGRVVELVLGPAADLPVEMRNKSVERALENLIQNALRYGKKIKLTVSADDEKLSYSVEDDGPGIPEIQREDALTPFKRLDTARNQDGGGGVGLGLAIAMDVARGHGGTLTLLKSSLGGLRAELTLAK